MNAAMRRHAQRSSIPLSSPAVGRAKIASMQGARIGLIALALAGLTIARAAAIDLDVTAEDIERALALARRGDKERALFHAPYVAAVDTTFVERIEVVTELRRVVRMAEDHIRRGDRAFSYSVTQAQRELSPWKQRVAIVARLRFHPQNTYVGVPAVNIRLEGHDGEAIGTLVEPVLAFATGAPGERIPILGAIVEATFDATTVGQTQRLVVVTVDKKEVASHLFDLGRLD